MESCEICGDDLRRYCSQGHVSGAGELFCDTCGELLPLSVDQPAMTPAAPLTMDYSSGSFSDFIAGADEDPGGTSGPRPGVPESAVALVDAPELDIPAPPPVDEPEPEPLPEPEVQPEPEPLADLVPEPEPAPEPEPEPAPEPPAPFSVWERRTPEPPAPSAPAPPPSSPTAPPA